MKTIITVIVIVFLIIWAISLTKSKVDPVDNFMRRVHFVIHRINARINKTGTKKDKSKDLEALLVPMNTGCVHDIYHIEDLNSLKLNNEPEFRKLLACGFIHNIFVISSLSAWESKSPLGTEKSLMTLVTNVLIPFLNSSAFISGDLDYNDVLSKIESSIERNQSI
jgi:hypothetical protein